MLKFCRHNNLNSWRRGVVCEILLLWLCIESDRPTMVKPFGISGLLFFWLVFAANIRNNKLAMANSANCLFISTNSVVVVLDQYQLKFSKNNKSNNISSTLLHFIRVIWVGCQKEDVYVLLLQRPQMGQKLRESWRGLLPSYQRLLTRIAIYWKRWIYIKQTWTCGGEQMTVNL